MHRTTPRDMVVEEMEVQIPEEGAVVRVNQTLSLQLVSEEEVVRELWLSVSNTIDNAQPRRSPPASSHARLSRSPPGLE